MIDQEICSFTNVNIRKTPQLEGKTCLLGTNGDKYHPLFELQLSLQFHEKE
jgi:hypothetical protein